MVLLHKVSLFINISHTWTMQGLMIYFDNVKQNARYGHRICVIFQTYRSARMWVAYLKGLIYFDATQGSIWYHYKRCPIEYPLVSEHNEIHNDLNIYIYTYTHTFQYSATRYSVFLVRTVGR